MYSGGKFESEYDRVGDFYYDFIKRGIAEERSIFHLTRLEILDEGCSVAIMVSPRSRKSHISISRRISRLEREKLDVFRFTP